MSRWAFPPPQILRDELSTKNAGRPILLPDDLVREVFFNGRDPDQSASRKGYIAAIATVQAALAQIPFAGTVAKSASAGVTGTRASAGPLSFNLFAISRHLLRVNLP